MNGYYNPYASLDPNGHWIKTQLHIHAGTSSDRSGFGVEEIFKAYKKAGYTLLMNSPQKHWEDTSKFGEKVGISSINGNEYAVYDGILLCGTKKLLKGSPQEVINACLRDGGFAIVCHPNLKLPPDYPALKKDDAFQLEGPIGVEIYNGCILRSLPGDGLATDFWDRLLSAGKVWWGFGSDDFHELHEMNVGWTEIYAKSENFTDIKEACKKGRLYASTGLVLLDFQLNENRLKITVDHPYERLCNVTYRFVGEGGALLGTDSGKTGKYTLCGNEKYVRAECISPDGSMLWCQPILNTSFYTSFLDN